MSHSIILPLHGLRGVAASTVVIGHLLPGGVAALGVVLFFLTSGFLLGRLYLFSEFSAGNLWKYAVARFARVYPLFATVVVATVLLNEFSPARVFGLKKDEMLQHLLLVGDASTIWTISTEFQFYLFFAALWFVCSKLARTQGVIEALFLFAAILAVWIGTGADRIGLIGYLHVFLLGVLIAQYSNGRTFGWTEFAGPVMTALFVLYVVVFYLAPQLYTPRWMYLDPISIGICAGLVACTTAAGTCFVNRVLSHAIPVWLGEISFGIYLLHRHAQWIVDNFWPTDPSPYVTFLPKVAVTLMLAHIAHIVIERPCRTWLRGAGEKIART